MPRLHPLPCKLFLALLLAWLLLLPSFSHSEWIQLAWDAPTSPADEIDGYKLFSRVEGEAYNYDYPLWTGPNLTVWVEILVPTYFVVRAYNSVGDSEDSNEIYRIPGGGEIAPAYWVSITADEISPTGLEYRMNWTLPAAIYTWLGIHYTHYGIEGIK